MWRRYSEFDELHTELTKSTGSPPPESLPPKHKFSILSLRPLHDRDEGLLEERRAGLEKYLRAIVSAKDDRWRENFAFRDFLGIPVGKQGSLDGAGRGGFSSSSWLDEYLELQNRIRDVRADINKRDALSDQGDVAASHTANVQAKKKLAEVLSKVRILTQGLQELAMSGMSEGELQRRTDMVARLQDDCEKLGKMVTVARQTSAKTLGGSAGASSASGKTLAPESDRAALFGAAFTKPAARVFGAAQPKETDETRPLDDGGLFQLQKSKMDQQDEKLSQLATILQRQKHLGEAIGAELATHNELLDGLSDDVDRVGDKLTSAKKQMNRLG